MRLYRWIPLILIALQSWSAWSDSPAPPPEIRLQELELVIRSLRAENRRLQERNELLANELIQLRRRMEETQPPRGEARPAEAEPEPPPPGNEILYVNPNWHYVLVGAGTAQNLQAGQEGRILRENAEIGRVRITATKDRQSVADILLDSLGDRGQYPRAGDRILFLSPAPETLEDDSP
ncbi:MAG: hypothetical protein JJU05_13035 [Verrucomicrobia bacterium]|nr:hypothetical protein [Verrucomicrobiota bacterium]MCH8527147.1 hypothetical protein [Kiritimatiellia bacterium]